MTTFHSDAFDLLDELQSDNTADWYRANRSAIECLLRAPMGDFLRAALRRLSPGEWPPSGGSGTVLSQRRDTHRATGADRSDR